MTSEKNPNLISFPSFSAITSSGKKKTTHQKSTYSPPRLKGSEIKRQMKFIHVGFIFWGSACWQRSGRNMLPGQLSLKFCCRYEMLKLSKILLLIIFYCSSEVTVRYITRRFCRSKIEPQGKWEKKKKSLLPPKCLPLIPHSCLSFSTKSSFFYHLIPSQNIAWYWSMISYWRRKAALFNVFVYWVMPEWHLFWQSLQSFLISD